MHKTGKSVGDGRAFGDFLSTLTLGKCLNKISKVKFSTKHLKSYFYFGSCNAAINHGSE
jgi:hypothetical protein